METGSLYNRSTSLTDAENWLALGTGALVAASSAPLLYRGITGHWPALPNGIAEPDNTKSALRLAFESHSRKRRDRSHVWNRQAMGHTEAAKLLQQTLDEEKSADKKLSGLAEGGINQECGRCSTP